MAGSWQSTQETLIEIADFLTTTYDNATATATNLESIVQEQRVVARHLEQIVDACKVKLEHERTGEARQDAAISVEKEQQELERLDEVLEQARRLREVSLKPTALKKRPTQKKVAGKTEHATTSAKKQNGLCKKPPSKTTQSDEQQKPTLELPRLPDDFLKLMAEYQQRCFAADSASEDLELQQSKSQFMFDLSNANGANDQGYDKIDDWSKGAAVIESIVLLLKVQAKISEGGELEMDPADIIDLWRDVSSAVKELDHPLTEVDQSDVVRWRNRALRMLLTNAGTVPNQLKIPEEMSSVWLPDECWKMMQNSEQIQALICCGTKPVMTYSRGAQLEKLHESREALQRLLFDTYLESHLAPKLIAAANDQKFSAERRAALCRLAHQFLRGKKKCAILRPRVGASE
ncbi:hypothetical protein BSKO_01897 [Bryopsis sp. KO-2023]|nr:hypothetical protein BSKO_01897 [Bryopsis sp. KO-2023]